VDLVALGVAFATGAAVWFGAMHARQRALQRRLADDRLRELRRPFDNGSITTTAAPVRQSATSVPVLRLLFARGTRGEEMQEALGLAGLDIRPGAFILTQALAALIGITIALLVAGTGLGLVVAVPLAVVGWFLPRAYLAYRTVKRMAAMDRQLVDMLSLMSSSIRAGFSLMQSLSSASNRVGPPLQVELERVLNDVRLGQRMEDALRAWSERVPSGNVRLLVTAMIVQRSAGGNLAEVLDNLAQTMRERVELRRQVSALTAYSRMTARVIGFYPLGIALVMTALNPGVYGRLWTEQSGWVLLGVALVMNVVAFITLRRVARVEL
jgi:tight adherence protein B